MSEQAEIVLSASGIRKSFAGVPALRDAQLTMRRGEVHSLLGENGAGKSTLIKVLTGVHTLDAGAVTLAGSPIAPANTRDAERLGISTVYQEVNLVPQLSVAENLCLGRFPLAGMFIRWGQTRRRAEEALERVGVKIDVRRQLDSYSIAIQQMVAIARAVSAGAEPGGVASATPNANRTKILILDEPTSSLDAGEVTQLFGVMERLRAGGLGILFVTHFLDQVYRISDRITVLRNGAFVGEWKAAELPRLALVSAMVGKELPALRGHKLAKNSGSAGDDLPLPLTGERAGVRGKELDPAKTLLQGTSLAPHPTPLPGYGERESVAGQGGRASAMRVSALARRGMLEPVSFDIPPGQTVGLAGLLGSGRTETAKLIFGLTHADAGGIEIDGVSHRFASPRAAIRHGLAMTTEDRRHDGIFPNLSVADNIVIALQARKGILRKLSRATRTELADKYVARMAVKTASTSQAIGTLSGGNQQKCLVARWLGVEPRLLILDEPTRGVDIGAKADIRGLIDSLREAGMAVLFISSELEEVADVSDHIVVLRDRKKVGEIDGRGATQEQILHTIAVESGEAEADHA